MSSEDQDERTESATGKRLGQAIGEGRIAFSRDAQQYVGLLAGVCALLALGARLRDAMVDMVVVSTRTVGEANFRNLSPYLTSPLRVTLFICASAAVASIVAGVAQTKGRFWPDKLFKGIELSGASLKRLFTKELFVDLGIALVKAMTVGWAVWSAIGAEFLTLPRLLLSRPDAQFGLMFQPLAHGAVKVLAAMGVLAGLDLALTRYRYRKALKMTKQEVKREARDDEGDPLIKGKRKSKHRSLLKQLIRVEVPRATALIVNPTHIAIAIRYRPGEDRAPIVTAKGKDALAETMRDLARSHGIPIVEDIPLARLLYKRVKIGRTVPAETYKAVAAVLAFVYRVTGRRPASSPRALPAPRRPEVRP